MKILKDSTKHAGWRNEQQRGRCFNCGDHKGITFVDCLAACAILLFGLLLLVTATGAAKPASTRLQCLKNLRQLCAAWRMYSDDNSGALVYCRDGASVGIPGSEAWVGGWLDFSASTDNTNTALLIDHKAYPNGAYLGSYLQTASVFKCPSDEAVVTIGGKQFPRVRSYSVNMHMGGSRTWSMTSRYKLYKNTSQMLSPASLYVFLDEHEGSINDGCFCVTPDQRYWLIDWPASRHQGGANFAFADGHVETHAWKDPRTMPPFQPGVVLPLNLGIPGNVDLDWLDEHTAELP